MAIIGGLILPVVLPIKKLVANNSSFAEYLRKLFLPEFIFTSHLPIKSLSSLLIFGRYVFETSFEGEDGNSSIKWSAASVICLSCCAVPRFFANNNPLLMTGQLTTSSLPFVLSDN